MSILTGCNSNENLSNNPQIIITSEKNIYEQDKAINIKVVIKNPSQDKLDLVVIPSFEISSKELKYGIWSPVRFSNDSQNLKANEKDRLVLLPKEEKRFNFNLNKLKWDRKISSFWPSKELTDLIGKGVYTVVFTLQGTVNNSPRSLASYSITIKILKK